MKKYGLFFIILFSLFTAFAQSEGNVVITVEQNKDARSESQRLAQMMTKYDRQFTGLYLAPGKELNIKLEILENSKNNELPKLVIGTPRRTNQEVKVIPLKEGENTISGNAHFGGMIYLEYLIKENVKPGRTKITFLAGENSFIKAPFYIKGKTTKEEFVKMMDEYKNAPDVTFMSDIMAVVVSKEAASKYSVNENIETWMNSIEQMLRAEDDISGINANDPNPLHHPLAKGIRYLFVEVNSGYMYATNTLTGYRGDAALKRLLTNEQITTNGWGVSHELGHQHQQAAYKPSYFTEVTVNIYSLAVWRMFNPNQERFEKKMWDNLINSYFAMPLERRNYQDKSSLEVVGVDINYARLLLFEQLNLLFGDEFFKRLHRITREERTVAGEDNERIFYLLWKTCQITGYDLREYFNQWGIKLLPYYQAYLDKEIERGNLKKPDHLDEFHQVTSYDKPEWIPIPLNGIKSSSPIVDPQPKNQKSSIKKYTDYSSSENTFTDPRDNKVYPYKKIDQYEWFTKNLDWDGYNGKDEATRGTVGVYGTADTDGSLYGRLYPMNAGNSMETWCPEGWTVATSGHWDNLVQYLVQEYNIPLEEVGSYLKAGGDRNEEKDGLWKKGAGSINKSMSAKIGFNILPAGVFNIESQSYDVGDEPGSKASFPMQSWYHIQISSSSNTLFTLNRNSPHYGSIRCVRVVEK